MIINTNMSALSSARLLSDSSNNLAKSLARLSSGSKITSAADDAAGLAVSTRFDAQINRITAASSNISNAISFNQTQDGFLNRVGKALDRMSELAILAQDATKSDEDRALYDAEFQQLADFIDDVATKTFNDVDLFDGTGLEITIDSDGNLHTLTGVDLADGNYAGATGASVDTAANAITALDAVKDAIEQLAEDRANVGANMSVLNAYNEQLGILRDNLTAANSRIRDVDVAEESARFAKYNILVQAGTAMLAQANASPQSALRLLA